jgi:hypothetical protein
VIGSLDEREPKGKESTITGVPCYIRSVGRMLLLLLLLLLGLL